MTTFQAIILGAIHGFSYFLPISAHAHHILVPFLIGWQEPGTGMLAALSIGASLAILISFRHDWASMVSCFLQVVIYRKRPMTLDERLPLFLILTSIPVAIATSYFGSGFSGIDGDPIVFAAIVAGFGLLLPLMDRMSRKTKNIYDLNWTNAFVIGLAQMAMIVPGVGNVDAVLVGALFLNFRREAALKYAFYAATPLLLVQTYMRMHQVNFHGPSAGPDLSWLSFWMALIVTFFCSLLAIGGFLKQIERKGLFQYFIYRAALAGAVIGAVWWKTRG